MYLLKREAICVKRRLTLSMKQFVQVGTCDFHIKGPHLGSLKILKREAICVKRRLTLSMKQFVQVGTCDFHIKGPHLGSLLRS